MVVLALGGVGIGITEFVSMGLLRLIADDFRITEDAAGHIITAYALGVVVDAPLITVFTGLFPRRRLLLFLMAAFTIGNGMSMFAGGYGSLLVARFIAGLPHGAYFSVSALASASMAPAGQRGRAMAFSGMGFSVGTVAGVPAAQALGQALGWQVAYALVAAVGLTTVTLLWFFMPHMTKMPATSPLTELSALSKPQVWARLAIGTIGFGGMFCVYTYISWTMTERAGLNPVFIPLVLAFYGLGGLAGTWFGGWLSDRNLEFGIAFAFGCILLACTGFYFTSQWPIPGTLNFGLVGFFGSALIPSLQMRLLQVAGKAQTLAAAMNQSALNLANAAGATLGGMVIARGLGYASPSLVGAGLAAIALVIWAVAAKLRNDARVRMVRS